MLGQFSLNDVAAFQANGRIANATAGIYESQVKANQLQTKLAAAQTYSGKTYGAMDPDERDDFEEWYAKQ